MKSVIIAMMIGSFSVCFASDSAKKEAASRAHQIAYNNQMKLAKNPNLYFLYGMATYVRGQQTSTKFMFDNKDDCIEYVRNWRIAVTIQGITYECVEREDNRPKLKVLNSN